MNSNLKQINFQFEFEFEHSLRNVSVFVPPTSASTFPPTAAPHNNRISIYLFSIYFVYDRAALIIRQYTYMVGASPHTPAPAAGHLHPTATPLGNYYGGGQRPHPRTCGGLIPHTSGAQEAPAPRFPPEPDQPSPARPAQRLELPSNPARGRSCRANSPRHAPNQTKPAPPSKQLEPDHLPPALDTGRGAPVLPVPWMRSTDLPSSIAPPALPLRNPASRAVLTSTGPRPPQSAQPEGT